MQPNNKRPESRRLAFVAGLIGFALNLFVWGWLIISMHSDLSNPLTALFNTTATKPVKEPEIFLMHVDLPGGGIQAKQVNETITETLASTAQPKPEMSEIIPVPQSDIKILSQDEFENNLDLHLSASSQAQINGEPENAPKMKLPIKPNEMTSLLTPEEIARQSLLKQKPVAEKITKGEAKNIFWQNAAKRMQQAMSPVDISNGSGKSKDIRFFSIRQRLRQHLMTSCKIALNHASQTARRAFLAGASPSFRIEVNADGSLACLKLANGSGSDALDSTFLKAIEGAQPFPELPKHLGIRRYSITDEVMVQ